MENTSNTFTITLDSEELVCLNSFNPMYEYTLDPEYKLQEILKCSFNTIKHTKLELVNFLTRNEALFLISSTTSLAFDVNYSPRKSLINHVADYIFFCAFDELYNVNSTEFLSKLEKLTEHQAYCIYQMCFEFWKDPNNKDSNYLERIFLVKQ